MAHWTGLGGWCTTRHVRFDAPRELSVRHVVIAERSDPSAARGTPAWSSSSPLTRCIRGPLSFLLLRVARRELRAAATRPSGSGTSPPLRGTGRISCCLSVVPAARPSFLLPLLHFLLPVRRSCCPSVVPAARPSFLLPVVLDARSIGRASRTNGSGNSRPAATRPAGAGTPGRRGNSRPAPELTAGARTHDRQRELTTGSGKSRPAAGSHDRQRDSRVPATSPTSSDQPPRREVRARSAAGSPQSSSAPRP